MYVREFVLTANDVFIENHSDDTQEAQIAQQGPFNTNTLYLDKESVILSFYIRILAIMSIIESLRYLCSGQSYALVHTYIVI